MNSCDNIRFNRRMKFTTPNQKKEQMEEISLINQIERVCIDVLILYSKHKRRGYHPFGKRVKKIDEEDLTFCEDFNND